MLIRIVRLAMVTSAEESSIRIVAGPLASACSGCTHRPDDGLIPFGNSIVDRHDGERLAEHSHGEIDRPTAGALVVAAGRLARQCTIDRRGDVRIVAMDLELTGDFAEFLGILRGCDRDMGIVVKDGDIGGLVVESML